MLIVLLRHGIAERGHNGVPDAERRLTPEGNREMKRFARRLSRLLPAFDEVYSSPLDRAHETAEWIAGYCSHHVPVITAKALAPAGDIDDFWRLVRSSNASYACFTGHEPQLTCALRSLTGLPEDMHLELEKGGCYGIEFDRSAAHGRLVWMLTPSLLT